MEPAGHRDARAEPHAARALLRVEARHSRYLAADVDGDVAQPRTRRVAGPRSVSRGAAARRVRADGTRETIHGTGSRACRVAAGELVDDPTGARHVRSTIWNAKGRIGREVHQSTAACPHDPGHYLDPASSRFPATIRSFSTPKTPLTSRARTSAIWRSAALSTTPSSIVRPFFTMM